MNVYDIRTSVFELLEDHSQVDVLLVNIPSRYMSPRDGLFELPCQHLERSSHNGDKLYGDQDYEPNHGLLSIAAYLQKRGIPTAVYDLQTLYYLRSIHVIEVDPQQRLYEMVKARAPRVVGCSCMIPSLPLAIELAKGVRQNLPGGALLTLGGLAVTEPEECFKDGCFDLLVEGEGEYIFYELVSLFLNGRPWDHLPGILSVRDGKVMRNKPACLKGQPDVTPAYDLLPRELKLIPRVYTMRGCPNGCGFCSPSRFFGQEMAARSSEEILREIDDLHTHYDFDVFLIGDLTLYLKSDTVKELCGRLREGDYHPWWCQTQVAQLDEDTVRMLKNARCCEVALGFEDMEAGDESIRSKNPGKEAAKEACRLLKTYGILVQGYWLFGTSQEDLTSSLQKIRDMCEMIREGLMDSVHISFLIPYPNAVLEGYVLDSRNYSQYLDLKNSFYDSMPMYHTENMSAKEIFLLTQLAISCCANEFYALDKR